MPRGKTYIGTSGWSYSSWKGNFYPAKMPSGEFLSFYAGRFNVSEVNNTFYHLPRVKTIEGWMERVPADFKFCLKLSRYITHLKKLQQPEEPLAVFMERVAPLQSRMGPVLIQLPPSLKFNPAVVEHFFALLRKQYSAYSFALEPRHDTWLQEKSIALMTAHEIAFAIAESGGRFPIGEFITSKNIYLRFHGEEKLYGSPHPDSMLKDYSEKIKKWRATHNIWVFFNNTMYDDALNNAATLKKLLE